MSTTATADRSCRLKVAMTFALMTLGLSPTLATDKCGEVGGETWTVAGSPYVVTDDCGTAGVTVGSGTTLTIDAGVEVRFWAGTGLSVSGTLDVNGAVGNEVLFASDAAVPAAGDWTGLYLDSGSSATLDNAVIRSANYGIQAFGSSATLSGVESTFNNYALWVLYGNTTTVDVTGCSFTDNQY